MSLPQISGYQLKSRLGQGAFGTVYQGLWNGDFMCAVKVLEEGALHRDYLTRVLEQLQDLPPHAGLLPVYAFDLEDEVPHISMALLPDGAVTFDDLAGRLTPEEAWTLLRQLAEVLAWLHENGLVHAGLTGGNVMVVAEEDGTPRALLTDVGQAWLGDGTMEWLHDQAPYVPPERWLEPDRVLQDGHAETWDVYAFGVLAWRLLDGRWPRANNIFDRVLASKGEILTVDPPAFAQWLIEEPAPAGLGISLESAGEEPRAMVLRCLAIDPAERPASMMEVAMVLRECFEAAPDELSALETGPDTVTMPVPLASDAWSTTVPQAQSSWVAWPEETAQPVALKLEGLWDTPEDKTPSGANVPTALTDGRGVFAERDTEVWIIPREKDGTVSEPVAAAALTAPVLAERKIKTPGTSGAGRRLALAASWALVLGGGAAAFHYYEDGQRTAGEMEQVKQEASQVRGEAALAEEKIRKLEAERTSAKLAGWSAARDEWSRLVSTLLAARPVEPLALEAWKPVATPVAERLKAALAAADSEPSLAAGGLEPGWQLAELFSVLGRKDEALPLLEKLARDLAGGGAGGGTPDGARQLLAARIGSRRGAILLEDLKSMEAALLLTEASLAYEGWLMTNPDRHEVEREFAVTSLLEGRALIERQQLDAARTALSRVAGLLGQPEEPGFLPQDHFTLTDTLFALAGVDSVGGKLEQAIEQHMTAVRLLVAYDQANRMSIPCRRRLAAGYFGLGKLLTKNGAPQDASVAFIEAVKLLSELSNETPEESFYRLQLALTYNEVAQLIRTSRPNATGVKEALEYQDFSVTILRNLNEANTLDNQLRQHFAASLVLNGELYELAGEPKTGLTRHREALTLLEELLAEPTVAENDRRECRRLSARAWTATGGIQEKAGRKDEAIASLSKALLAWSGFAVDDPAAHQNVASTRERLRKLKPES
jgi:serine/threonine protein kinase/tetratricopeptide (TPR) repeat protein